MFKQMMSLNKSALIALTSLSIWVVAILINAIADVTHIAMTQAGWIGIGVFGAILMPSAIFSLPGILVFWLIFLLNKKNKNLVYILMITGIVTSAASVLLLLLFIGQGLKSGFILFVFIAALSGFISTALRNNLVNAIVNKE